MVVAPIVIAAGIAGGAQVLSSIAQYYNGEKARKANQERLDEIKALYDSIKPPQYDVSIFEPPDFIRTAIPEAAFDLSRITPQQYAVAAKFIPEVAQYIGEQNPQIVQQTAAGAAGRQAQVAALTQIRQRTGELSDAEAQDASGKAMRDAQIASQSRSQSILQDSNRRGQLGSGAMLAAQLQGSSDQMERGANLSSNAYLEALRQKMGSLRDSGTMGRNLAQDELGQQETNASIINSFNQRASTNANRYLQNAADTRNEGQRYNVQNQQDVSNRNTGTNNEFDKMNRQREDAILEYLDKRRLGERDYQNDASSKTYQARVNEVQRQNNIKTQSFNNELKKADGVSGVSRSFMDNTNQAAADRNQAYQGMSDMVGGVARSYGNYQSQSNRDYYQKDRDKVSDAQFEREMALKEKKANYGQ